MRILTDAEILDAKLLSGLVETEGDEVKTKVGLIVKDLLHDLNDRRGIKWALQEVDEDTMFELICTHMKIIIGHIEA